jgi:hypothetical protein
MLAVTLAIHPSRAPANVAGQLHIESHENAGDVSGRVQALVSYPTPLLVEALKRPAAWCEVLILHLNVKYCGVEYRRTNDVLRVGLGRKQFQSLGDVHWIDFDYAVISGTDDHLEVILAAAQGPFGTRDYRIELRASPVGDTGTAMRFDYSLRHGLAGRLAMQAFLAAGGRNKVGFTALPLPTGGSVLVGGLRGAVERNVVRYFLAIEAYLAAQAAPAEQRAERSLALWFTATEVHSRQLHEMDREEYLAIKRHELARLRLNAPMLVATQP